MYVVRRVCVYARDITNLGRDVRGITVIEEQFLPRLYLPTGIDADLVLAVGRHHPCVAVGVLGVVRELDLVALARGIHHVLVVEVEEETAVQFVVDFTPPVGLVLGYHLADVPDTTWGGVGGGPGKGGDRDIEKERGAGRG